MNLRTLLLFGLSLVTASAMAQTTVYDNGQTNGTTDAWTINFGFVVSDSFPIVGPSSVNGMSFAAWLFPGDVLEDAEVQITSSEFGGSIYLDQVVNFTASGCSGNQYGFNVCTETGSFNTGVNLSTGTYWLNLDNAVVNDDPVYWDENSGPSSASENSIGTIPSEAFTLLGSISTQTAPPPTVPEPSSILLLGSGMFAVAGRLRRKRF